MAISLFRRNPNKKQSPLEMEIERIYTERSSGNVERGTVFDSTMQKEAIALFGNGSDSIYGQPALYDLIKTGAYKNKLPEGFFPNISIINNGAVFMDTTRRDIVDSIPVFEWYFTALKNGTVLKEFMNDQMELNRNYLLIKFTNRSTLCKTIQLSGIYDLSSNEYIEYHDLENPDAIKAQNQKLREFSSQENVFWNDLNNIVSGNGDEVKMVPKSLHPSSTITALLALIRNGDLELNTP